MSNLIPTPMTIGEDAFDLAKAFNDLPFAKVFKNRLLRGIPERVLGSEDKNAIGGILDYLKGVGKGAPGMEQREIAPDVFSHIFRDEGGNPVGFMNREPGKVISLGIDPNASPISRGRALLQLARPIVEHRLDPGEMTSEGAAMLEKLRTLAGKYLKK